MTPETPMQPDSLEIWATDARFFLSRLPTLMPNSTAEGIMSVNNLMDRAHSLIRTARNEALEEAAKLADVEASTGEYTGDLAREGQHRNMAIRIRQLKHKDGQP